MRAVDLSTDVAGGFAAKLMAMAGIEVLRPAGPGGGRETPALGRYLDVDKRPVAVPDPEALSALVAAADVVYTTFDRGRPLGLGADAATRSLPDTCVHVTTSTFGTTGPYASQRGGALAEWSVGGYLAITGEPDREPLMGPEHLCAYVAGYTAAVAVEAALHDRRRTGLGQRLDISTMESMLSVHQATFARLAAGWERRRTGRYADVYPLVVRPCRDGFVALGVVTDAEFDRFAIAIGRGDLVTDPRFAEQRGRGEHCDELDREMEQFLLDRDADEIVTVLQAHRVAAAEVAEPPEVFANPQLAAREFWEHEDDGGRRPGNPVRASTTLARGPGDARVARTIPLVREADGLPLAGVVVADFTAFWAGPSATRILADLGADVVWVERPFSRADVDPTGPTPGQLVGQLFHAEMNRNKRSVVIDLATAAGVDAARRLVAQADVLVENLRPGVMDRLGLGPATLCGSHPDLVYVSLSGFGATGPWGERASYGPTLEAASSIEGRTGYHGGEPLRLGHALPDAVGGLAGALAALRGLRERAERGGGGWFDISQLEAYTAMAGEDLLEASRGQPFPRVGNRSRHGAVQGVFPCAGHDEWIAVRLVDPGDIERFAQVAELPELVGLARAAPRDDDAVEELLAAFTAPHDKHELAARLQGAGLEAVPVFRPSELLADAHLADREFFADVTFGAGVHRVPGSPLRSSRRLVSSRGAPPGFGEHTAGIAAALGAVNRDLVAELGASGRGLG